MKQLENQFWLAVVLGVLFVLRFIHAFRHTFCVKVVYVKKQKTN